MKSYWLIICVIFIVLPDGSIKAQEAHSSLFQTSDVWFTACNSKSIIDDRSSRSDSALSFDICQADDRDEYNERKLVYDTINDYFKIITSVEQLKEVCEKEVDRCHLLPMMATVVNPKDVHIEIVPHGNRRFVLNVEKTKGNAPYGKVSMIKRKNLRKLQALLKIEVFSWKIA